MVPGGRIELPTPAFSGPRSTGELPRHRHKRRFYGARAQESNGPLNPVNGAARHGGGKSGSRLARFSNGSMPTPPSAQGPNDPCSCGQRARNVDRRWKRFESLWRELKLERHVLSCHMPTGFTTRHPALGTPSVCKSLQTFCKPLFQGSYSGKIENNRLQVTRWIQTINNSTPPRKTVSVWHSMCALRAVASELYRAETAGCAYSGSTDPLGSLWPGRRSERSGHPTRRLGA